MRSHLQIFRNYYYRTPADISGGAAPKLFAKLAPVFMTSGDTKWMLQNVSNQQRHHFHDRKLLCDEMKVESDGFRMLEPIHWGSYQVIYQSQSHYHLRLYWSQHARLRVTWPPPFYIHHAQPWLSLAPTVFQLTPEPWEMPLSDWWIFWHLRWDKSHSGSPLAAQTPAWPQLDGKSFLTLARSYEKLDNPVE